MPEDGGVMGPDHEMLVRALSSGATLREAMTVAEINPRPFDKPTGYYVYLLCDPLDHEPFYVGKGKGTRALQHARIEEAGKEPNHQKAIRLQAIRRAGLDVEVSVLADGLSEMDAFAIERAVIESSERLTNIAPGQSTALERWRWSLRRSLALFEALDPTGADPEIIEITNGFAATCRRMLALDVTEEEMARQERECKVATREARAEVARLMGTLTPPEQEAVIG